MCSSTPVWGWKQKGDRSLKGATYIQIQPPLPPNPRALTILDPPLTQIRTQSGGKLKSGSGFLRAFPPAVF